jgi:hypothetical protein
MVRLKYNIFRPLIIILILAIIFSTININIIKSPFIKVKAEGNEYAKSIWIKWASKAWKYFENTIDASTGLPRAGLGWPYFTDWDLGNYLLAIMAAQKIGIISKNDADNRINKVLLWLKTRELTPSGISYNWYSQITGKHALNNDSTNVSDLGHLLIALHRIKDFKPENSSDIDYIVKIRENTVSLASDPAKWTGTSGVYEYYVAHGFAYFGYDIYKPVADALMNLKLGFEGPKVSVYGINLPKMDLTSEPILYGIFNLDPDPLLAELARYVYLAQEARYDATGNYTAFTEGNTGLDWPSYIYEWVMTGSGNAWVITPTQITPIIFFKVAVGFHAIYNSSYTKNMIDYINSSFPDWTNGYRNGIDENGRLVDIIIDSTNAMVIFAAKYAIDKLSTPSLSTFPAPFINGTGYLDAIFTIGDTNHHGIYGWQAYTWDVLGAIGIASKLGRLSSSGETKAILDSWATVCNASQGKVRINWTNVGGSRVIIVGGPCVNMISYAYQRYGGIPFYLIWIDGRPYLHSELTNNNYTFTDNFNKDYFTIVSIYNNQKNILLVWGLTAYGTLAASQVLQYHDSVYAGKLHGQAMILQWTDNGDGEVGLEDEISIIETWP